MTSEDLQAFNAATTLAGNNPEAAYNILKELVQRNPNDANLLSWLIFTAPAYSSKEQWVNRAKAVAPHDATVQQALSWFDQQPKPQPAAIPHAYTPPPLDGSLNLTQPNTFQEQLFRDSTMSNRLGNNTSNAAMGDDTVSALRRKVKPDAGSSEALAARARRQKWFVPAIIGGVVFVLLAGAGLFFWLTSPNYVEYLTADDVLAKADKGTYAKFRIKLDVDEYFSNPDFDFYGWLTTAYSNTSGKNDLVDRKKQPLGLLLKFDRSNPKVRPSGGEATYFVKVGEAYLNSKMVVADVLKVENTLERDILPVRELPEITVKRVTRTNSHQGLGLSNNQSGRFWLVVDIEVKSPKANPNVTSISLWNDIKQNSGIVLVNNSGSRDYREWIWADAQPKNTPSDRYYIFAGQIVTEVQSDWKQAFFSGNVGNTSFEVPISLTR